MTLRNHLEQSKTFCASWVVDTILLLNELYSERLTNSNVT